MLDAIATTMRCCLLGSLTALLMGLLPASADAAEPASTIIVFDGSGSMWGKLGGDKETKFANAREALRRALPKLVPSTRVGLAAFGHRRKGDCSDTQVMLEPEPVDLERLMTPLEKFNPKGKGPLVAALKEAAGDLADAKGHASLLLIHDDPDNCAQDPCAAAEELAKSNPKLAVHVVSIGLAKTDAQRMACVPRVTGGRHFDVQDAAALGPAIEEALSLVSLDAKPATIAPAAAAAKPVAAAPAPAAPPPEDKGPPGLRLSATLGPQGPAVIAPLAWRVTAGGANASQVAVARAASLDLALPAGTYTVEARHGLVGTTQTVEVKPKGATRLALALPAGAVRMSASLQKGTAPLEQALFAITDVAATGAAAKTVWTGGADAPPVFLPEGTWRVAAELDRARAERQVTVTAGAMIDAALVFGAGRLRVKAAEKDGGLPLERVTFRVTEDDADSADGRREVARSTAVEPEFTLPAGTYYLSARQGQVEVRERVLVNAGDDVARTLLLPIGRLALQSRLAGVQTRLEKGVGYRIDRLDGQQESLRLASAIVTVELPAGRYRVESQLGSQNVRIARELEVKAGATAALSFEHLAANVQLKLAGAAPAGDLAWEIRDAQNRVLGQTLQAEPRFYLAAGRYKVLAESRDRKGAAEIEIKAGETRVVEVKLE